MPKIMLCNVSAQHNLPLLASIPRKPVESLKARLRPATYRNRLNLWIMAAGMLDSARFMNATMGTTKVPGNPEAGNESDKEIYSEMCLIIMMSYKSEMFWFRNTFRHYTANFAADKEIKKAIYDVVMNLPKDRVGAVSPFWVLEKAVRSYLRATNAEAQKKTSTV